MTRISGKKAIDAIDLKYKALKEGWKLYPLAPEIIELLYLIEEYRGEACYYHDRFIECLYS